MFIAVLFTKAKKWNGLDIHLGKGEGKSPGPSFGHGGRISELPSL